MFSNGAKDEDRTNSRHTANNYIKNNNDRTCFMEDCKDNKEPSTRHDRPLMIKRA